MTELELLQEISNKMDLIIKILYEIIPDPSKIQEIEKISGVDKIIYPEPTKIKE